MQHNIEDFKKIVDEGKEKTESSMKTKSMEVRLLNNIGLRVIGQVLLEDEEG
jgi:hypothetical protein